MTNQDLIRELNESVKCTLRPSPIHGIGVFALREIKQGEKLYCQEGLRGPIALPFKMFNQIKPEIREIILSRYPLVQRGSLFLSPNDDQRLISFMNHSKENANYDGHTDTATRDIKRDEEVLENYNDL